ncbi:MAG: phosphodiesterase [Pseudomonadales bacterium]|nr:phosphodiesterase [Pseudomonadales bacterium]
MTISHFFIVFAIGLALSAPLNADVVTIGVGQQAATKQSLSRPHKGMEKQQVYSHFGDPINQTNTIGEPPISSWVFDEFTVYFEYDHVVHTVLHDSESKPIE